MDGHESLANIFPLTSCFVVFPTIIEVRSFLGGMLRPFPSRMNIFIISTTLPNPGVTCASVLKIAVRLTVNRPKRMQTVCRPVARTVRGGGGGGVGVGGAHLENRDQIIKVIQLVPKNNFEIWGLRTVGNAIVTVNPTINTLFCIGLTL